jgi:hypothetical protein
VLIEFGKTGVVLFLVEQFRGYVFSGLKIEVIICEFLIETPSRRTVVRVSR